MIKMATLSTNGYPSSKRKYMSVFTQEQAKEMLKEGVSVEIFDLAPDILEFPENCKEVYDGVTVHRVHPIKFKQWRQDLNTILYLREHILKGKFNVIKCSFLDSQYMKYLPWIYRKNLHRLCFDVMGRDAMIPYGGLKNFVKKYIKIYLFKMSDFCFPVTEYTETLLSCLVKRKESDSGKIKVVYNGIDEKKFSKVIKIDKKDLRRKLRLPEDKFIVITVCQLIERKGVFSLVKGVLKSLDKHRNIFHIIIGKGNEEEKLKRLVNNSPYKDHFLFLSNLSDEILSEYFAASDVYSMLSKTLWEKRATEGFGISYAEASYLGIPIICGKDGGGTIAVQNNFTGFWIDPRREDCVDKIVEKLCLLIEDEGEYRRLSENGKLYARREFSWKKNVTSIVHSLEKSLEF